MGASNEATSKVFHPILYSPETGVYQSTYPPIDLPCLDIVSFILSHKHDGIPALIDSSSGFSVSYPKLFSLVKSMAAGLHHHTGIKQGDVVFISLANSIYFPIIFLGALSLGAIVTPTNPSNSLFEVKKQVLESKASLAFVSADRVDELVGVFNECRCQCQVVGVPPESNFKFNDPSDMLFVDIISTDALTAPTPIIRQQDTAAILYSSGTTGGSKGVLLTHANFIAMVQLFVRFEASLYDYPSTESVYLAILPMFHVYGLSLFVMGLLSLGTTIVVMKRFDAGEMVKAIDKYGVTHLPIVPPLMTTLIRERKSCSFNSLKQVSCGAAPLSNKTIQKFIQTFPQVDFIQGYGMTESSALGTRGFNSFGVGDKHSSAGLLSPNSQAKVVDWVTGFLLPPGKTGELWLKSPGLMKGYLNNIEATMSTIDKDGWLHTGDIVYFDEEGYMYVVDRLKDVIKYNGYQVAPADLEAVLISHPDIVDVAVTGESAEEAGEIPVAFVVLKNGSSVTKADLMDYVANQVAPYKKIRKVYFRQSIPRSAAGKILRKELRSFLCSRL